MGSGSRAGSLQWRHYGAWRDYGRPDRHVHGHRGAGHQIHARQLSDPHPRNAVRGHDPLGEEEQLRIVALVRFIMPDGFVRIAAGRNTMKDHGRKIFMSGANAAISGDMLTTAGVTIREDLAMLAELGYEVRMK